MENHRQKAIALVGEQQIKDLEHAFDYWTDVRRRYITQASDNWYPFDFFHHFLQEAENIPEDICKSYYKLNAQGIDLRERLSAEWNKCTPIKLEDCYIFIDT